MRGEYRGLAVSSLGFSMVWFAALYFATAKLSIYSPEGMLVPNTLALFFWLFLTTGLLALPLAKPTALAFRAMASSKRLLAFFFGYISVHLVIYGFLLERILVAVFGAPPGNTGAAVLVSSNFAIQPHTWYNMLLLVTVDPNLTILAPPYYGVVLGPFSIISALIIAILVVGNFFRLMKVSSAIRKWGGSTLIPFAGIVGGASCCISIPELLAAFSPAIYAVTLAPLGVVVLNVLYYALPISVAVALKLNLDSLSRVPVKQNGALRTASM
jgi:hypothetical protein